MGNKYSSDKPPVQARKLLSEAQVAEFIEIPHLSRSYSVASAICLKIENIEAEMKAIKHKYKFDGLAAAAELARIFRNHIVHGKDNTPLSGERSMVSHLYSVSRLLLLLIQVLTLLSLKDRNYLSATLRLLDRAALAA